MKSFFQKIRHLSFQVSHTQSTKEAHLNSAFRFSTLAFALIPNLSLASAPAQQLASLPDLVEKVLPGVVNISSTQVQSVTIPGWEDFGRFWGIPQERRSSSLGSGFIIDKDGFMITNHHVIERATEVLVTLVNKKVVRARIVGSDKKTDVALLKLQNQTVVDESDESKKPETVTFTPVPIGNSDTIRIGEPVFAVGNPFGLQHTVTTGIISAKNRTIGVGPFDNFLQTDASINPGNSGGPLFNFKGEVVGINTVIYSRTGQSGGLGFAIPAQEAMKLLADLKKYGRIPRPWLGILGERVTPAVAQYYRLGRSSGVLVYNLVQDGPALLSGVQRGDIIYEIAGVEIEDVQSLERELAKHRPSEKIAVKIFRGQANRGQLNRSGNTRTITIQVEELPKISNLPEGIV